MRHLERYLIVLLFVMFSIISGCGSSSTDSDSEDSEDSTSSTTEASSTVTCSQDNLCKGTYTSNVIAGEGLLNGPCHVSHADGGQSVKIVFKSTESCDFSWVKASGDTGLYWLNLIGVNKKLTVHHKGDDVYLLRAFN